MTEQAPSARAAVALWYALGVFGVLNVAYLWVRRDALDAAARDGVAVTALLVQLTALAVVFGAGYVVFARFLWQRKGWARGALTVVAAVHVLWIVLSRAAAPNVVVLLLIAAGLALTWLRGTAEWVKQH
ncbi:hypothetical protein ACQPZF_39785 [Actinosynnema sp. CS-041913]|uniref:hypothetical protein n=1 Tax=Actinosynnema sp. CS-041913 TaxID=3239917 RepID=UPI003D8E381A